MTPPVSTYLDQYGTWAGVWSPVKLTSDSVYSGATMRGRRSTDNAEANFTSAEVTDGTLETWASGGDVFVVTLWDQSGAGRDLTQATTTLQPKIVSSGVLEVEGDQPAMVFNSSTLRNLATSYTVTAQSIWTVVVSPSANLSYARLFTQTDATQDSSTTDHYIPLLRDALNDGFCSYIAVGSRSAVDVSKSTHYSLASIHTGSAVTNYANNNAGAAFSDTINKVFTRISLGAGITNIEYFNGKIQGVIMALSDMASNRAEIETWLNNKFTIY